MKESVIQESIVAYLSLISRKYGILFFSVPNEASVSGTAGKDFGRAISLKKMGVTPGVSDLVIGHNARMYCLEVKNEKGRQSKNQILFERWCIDCYVPYRVVRSVEDVQNVLKEWGIVKCT